MSSSQPSTSCSVMSLSEESSVVQVLDSSEPLVAASSSGAPCVQVLDSSPPLVHVSSCDQVLDSSEPLVHQVWLVSDHVEPVAGCSRYLDDVSSLSASSDDEEVSPPSEGTLRSCMNIVQLFKELGTPEQCITFAEAEGLLPKEKICTRHRRPMYLRTDKSAGRYGIYRCIKENCTTKSVSRAKGTWFENTKLSITTIFHLMYMFCYDYPIGLAWHNASNEYDPKVTWLTVTEWYSHCRQTIVLYQKEKEAEKPKIGGSGKIVQIEQLNFGRRNNNRGRHTEGLWVIGMITDSSDDLRLEVCSENELSAGVLGPLIQNHVQEGTEVHTDSWSAYECLPQYGYIHKKVNYSNPENRGVAPDAIHTQRFKSHWKFFSLKSIYRKHKKSSDLKDWLLEYRWRQRIRLEKKCAFRELINTIKHVYPVK